MMVATEVVAPKRRLKIKFGSQSLTNVDIGKQLSSIGEFNHQKPDSSKASSAIVGDKRRSEAVLSVEQPRKRLKLDRMMKKQCLDILKILMKHQCGWAFVKPVDPIKMNIPDYFLVIKNPMDLGTVKSKLEKDRYLSADEFGDDIRLTFSNAMLYNPPNNAFHDMAVVLGKIFENKWKTINPRTSYRRSEDGEASQLSKNESKIPMVCKKSLLKRLDKVKENAVEAQIKLPEPKLNTPCSSTGKRLHKGTNTNVNNSHATVDRKKFIPASSKCGSHIRSASNVSSVLTNESSAVIDRSSRDNLSSNRIAVKPRIASKLNLAAMSNSTLQTVKSGPESDGTVSSVDNENGCPSSQSTVHAIDAASEEVCPSSNSDVQMSPRRALRAEMIKSRFARTILKAQHKTLLDHSIHSDPVKLQQERERLERKHIEEKARIEAKIKAAEAALQLQAEMELKRKVEMEREAARTALQKMGKTVEFQENLQVVEELKMLCGGNFSSAVVVQVSPRPLEQFGLFLKAEYIVDDDEEDEEEEGEIFY